ncbi:MAG TPA: TonB-dependent receptor, partial [Longimicrobiales bacterium]|nr:TonB-dependent receptor [Longimicrobiales bacterium]
FFENFATGFTRGDPDLEPEQARSSEVGAEYVVLRGDLVVGASWFDQRFRNLIQYTFNTPTPEDPNYYNVGAARARGLELSASARTGSLTAAASYTYTSTRVTDDGFGEDMTFQDGRRLLRRPTHQASVNASLRLTSAATALLGARYTGSRDDLDFTDPAQFNGIRTTLGEYTVVDAGLVYGIVRGDGPTVDISAGVRNVVDREYQEIYNFPTPGRVLYLGFRAGVGL